MTVFERLRIASTGSYAPARVVPNAEIIQGLPTTEEWIETNLGIRQRHIAEADEVTSDLAARAGLAAIEGAGLDRNDIGMIIVATATPDRKSPSTACIAQAKMGITNHCPAFDVAAVCSGFIYGLTIAAHFIEMGTHQRVLVIGADAFSKITDWRRRDCVFFGDGAGAVVVERNPAGGGFFSSLLYSDGAGMDGFTVFPGDRHFTMNARAVYETGTTVIPETIRELLCRHALGPEDVAMVVSHQPSIKVLRKTAELLGMPFEKVRTNMQRYANTAGATVPLLLDELHRNGEIESGQMLLMAAVGAGWTWGAALYRWL